MLRHIVLFKFRKEILEEALQEATQRLSSLKSEIQWIRSMEIGKDILRRSQSYELALTIVFDSLEAYLKYDAHPAHIAVKEYILSVREDTVSVDYEY